MSLYDRTIQLGSDHRELRGKLSVLLNRHSRAMGQGPWKQKLADVGVMTEKALESAEKARTEMIAAADALGELATSAREARFQRGIADDIDAARNFFMERVKTIDESLKSMKLAMGRIQDKLKVVKKDDLTSRRISW